MKEVLLQAVRACWSVLPKHQQSVGQVHGLPTTRGVLIATHGVHGLVEQTNGLLVVHKEWWVKDKREPVVVRIRKDSTPKEVVSELVNKYLEF